MIRINQSPQTGIIHFSNTTYKHSFTDCAKSKDVRRNVIKDLYAISRQASTAAKLEGHTITYFCITQPRKKSRKHGLQIDLYIAPINSNAEESLESLIKSYANLNKWQSGMFTTVDKSVLSQLSVPTVQNTF